MFYANIMILTLLFWKGGLMEILAEIVLNGLQLRWLSHDFCLEKQQSV